VITHKAIRGPPGVFSYVGYQGWRKGMMPSFSGSRQTVDRRLTVLSVHDPDTEL
jgi:hypothetical protein